MHVPSNRVRLASLLLGLFIFVTAWQAADAQDGVPSRPYTFEPAPCPFEGADFLFTQMTPADIGFECGYVVVPERHANPDGPIIRLPVAILRSTSPSRQPDPLFLAQGGPGGSAFEIFSFTVPNSPIAQDRDIVIFNQRGTQYAEPELFCTELFDATGELLEMEDSDTAVQAYNDLLMACHQRLVAAGIDLSAYNSLENAADVDAIRQALGYESYNFYGVSYGTLLGLHLMRTHPEHLRSVILDGVVPPNLNFIPEVPRTEDRILDELFAACAADPACSHDYPDLEARYFALVDQLNAAPLRVTVMDPDTGRRYRAVVDGDTLRNIIFQVFYVEDATAIVPRAIAELEQGQTQFIASIWPLFEFDRTFSVGMYFSVICSEDADFVPDALDLTNLPPAIANTAVDDLQEFIDSCALWPVDLLPGSIDDPVTSEIPTLLLSGQLDPITPPAFAAVAAASLTNSTAVVDPSGSHGIAFTHPCINQIVQDFIDDPATVPDSSCLAFEEPAAVVPADALTVPIMGDLGNLDRTFAWQAGVAGLLLVGVLSAYGVWLVVLLVRVIGKRPWPLTPAQTRLRRVGQLLVLIFGLLALVFVIGLAWFAIQTLFNNTVYIYVNAVPGTAWPFFIIPPVLFLLAIGIMGVTTLIWREKEWPTGSKLYFTFLAICAAGYVLMLTYQGLTTVLFNRL